MKAFLFFCVVYWMGVTGIYAATSSSSTSVPAPDARDYNRQPNEQEIKDITFVISTLTGNALYLGFKKSELNRRGKATSQVHPLRYFLFVLTNDDLRQNFHNMNSIAWDRFRGDFAESMRRERERNNMEGWIIEDFCAQLKLSGLAKDRVESAYRGEKWLDLMDAIKAIASPSFAE